MAEEVYPKKASASMKLEKTQLGISPGALESKNATRSMGELGEFESNSSKRISYNQRMQRWKYKKEISHGKLERIPE